MPENITLTALQIYRLISVIQHRDLELYNRLNSEVSKCYRLYSEYDGLNVYTLEFADCSFTPTRKYYFSWDVSNPVHDYILYNKGVIK